MKHPAPLTYMLGVILDPLQSRERRDAMARAAIDRMERHAQENEDAAARSRGMEEAGSAAAEKLERLLSGSS